MPKTKFQKFTFGSMMALIMVYGMEVYNSSILHGGLTNSDLLIPVQELLFLMVIVISLETLIGGPLARKMAFNIVSPEHTSPLLLTLTISVKTVCCMCPMMSLVATLLFKGIDAEIAAKWIQTTAVNFPMALCWQLFIAGPLVRFVFGRLFVCNTVRRSIINPGI